MITTELKIFLVENEITDFWIIFRIMEMDGMVGEHEEFTSCYEIDPDKMTIGRKLEESEIRMLYRNIKGRTERRDFYHFWSRMNPKSKVYQRIREDSRSEAEARVR